MTSFLPHFREPAHRSLLVAFLIILTLSGMDSVAMADDLQAVSAPQRSWHKTLALTLQ